MLLHQTARENAARWARDLLARTDWAILDTETTGLDGQAQVIQVAVVEPGGAVLLDTLAKPQGRIPSDAIAVHGITDEMVAAAPAYVEVHRQLEEALLGRTVIAYNAAFDSRLLLQTALRNRLRPLGVTWACAMEMYAQYVGAWSSRHGSYRYQKLPRGPSYRSDRHQAIDDCLATLDLIRRMAT